MYSLLRQQNWFELDRPVWWTGILLSMLVGTCL